MHAETLKDHISLKKCTLFSISVYYGVLFIAFLVCQSLLNDRLSFTALLISILVASTGWLLLIAASLLYPAFRARQIKWFSVLPLGANAVVLLIACIVSTSELSSKIELSTKWQGFNHVAQQVESGAIPGTGAKPLPEGNRHLTRVSGKNRDLDIDRRGGVTQIFFPLEEGFLGDTKGIIYLSKGNVLPNTNSHSADGGRLFLGKKDRRPLVLGRKLAHGLND